jgi:hypothetical protein
MWLDMWRGYNNKLFRSQATSHNSFLMQSRVDDSMLDVLSYPLTSSGTKKGEFMYCVRIVVSHIQSHISFLEPPTVILLFMIATTYISCYGAV